MWVKFIGWSHPLRVFLRVLRLSSPHKNQLSKFQFDLETVDKKSHIVECPVIIIIIIITIIIIIIIISIIIIIIIIIIIQEVMISCIIMITADWLSKYGNQTGGDLTLFLFFFFSFAMNVIKNFH